MRIVAIDPGLSGGWAVLEDGRPILCGDMPTAGEPPHRRVSASVLAPIITDADLCVVELSWPRPTDGTASAFRFGSAFGIALGVAGAIGVPVETVSPQAWRRHFRLNHAGKEGSRAKAIDLAPQLVGQLDRKRDHGRAEALLIGLYAVVTFGMKAAA